MERIVANANEDLCIGCQICEYLYPYGAVQMEDRTGRPVSHIVIGTLRKNCSSYGTVSPAEVIKIERFATEGIVAQAQIDLLKAEP